MDTTTATTTTPRQAATEPPRSSHDVRRLWRTVLALVAPLPFVAKGIFYLLSPVDGDASFADQLAASVAHPALADALRWFDVVFVVGLIPATCAAAWVARRGAPRLTTTGALIALTGFLAGIALLGGVNTPAVMTSRHHLDPDAMAALYAALGGEPLMNIAGLLFIVGIVFGLGFLGAALWRSRAIPAWMGIALLVGGSTHPFIPGHTGQGVGLLVAAIGFVGTSLALLRMPDDEFDLPPARSARARVS